MEYTIYIYTHEQSENSPTKIKQQIDPANKGNKKLYLPVKNKTNLSTNWKKTKARYQVGNRAMKTKLANMLEESKEEKERKNRYTKLNRGR